MTWFEKLSQEMEILPELAKVLSATYDTGQFLKFNL